MSKAICFTIDKDGECATCMIAYEYGFHMLPKTQTPHDMTNFLPYFCSMLFHYREPFVSQLKDKPYILCNKVSVELQAVAYLFNAAKRTYHHFALTCIHLLETYPNHNPQNPNLNFRYIMVNQAAFCPQMGIESPHVIIFLSP